MWITFLIKHPRKLNKTRLHYAKACLVTAFCARYLRHSSASWAVGFAS